MCPLGHLEHPRAPNLSVYLPGDKRRPQACNTQPSHDALQLACVGRLGQRKPNPERRAYGFPAGRGPSAPCACPEGPQPPGRGRRQELGLLGPGGHMQAAGRGGRCAGRPVRREGTAQGGLHGRVAGSARGRHGGRLISPSCSAGSGPLASPVPSDRPGTVTEGPSVPWAPGPSLSLLPQTNPRPKTALSPRGPRGRGLARRSVSSPPV